jgi:hypothetical protein
MNCREYRRFTVCHSDPSLAVPMLKTIAPDAALRVIVPLTDGLHKRDNVDSRFLRSTSSQPEAWPSFNGTHRASWRLVSRALAMAPQNGWK